MSNSVYKTIEITGTSPTDVADAVRTAVAKASETVRNIDWFEVVTIRGAVAEGAVATFQVTLKIGFRLD
jgi:flavin-binding protein dodecin